MTRPAVIVVRTAGTNCEAELCRAFELAGAAVDLVHVDTLAASPGRLERADVVGLPGGFSYGDDIAAGRVLAATLRDRLWPALRSAVSRGAGVIGVCNGFQAMVQLGLLPGPDAGVDGVVSWPASPPRPSLGLVSNSSGRFVDRWVGVEAEASSVCVWTRALVSGGFDAGALVLPVAHGEGRLVARDSGVIASLGSTGRVALRYASGDDPNGSSGRIAGVCDASGRVFGLMPHPERYLSWSHHPWRRVGSGETPGLAMFRSALEACAGARA